jgi:hypothetical protein
MRFISIFLPNYTITAWDSVLAGAADPFTWEPVRELGGAAFRAPSRLQRSWRGQMPGAGPQAMSMYMVEARQQRRCPRALSSPRKPDARDPS